MDNRQEFIEELANVFGQQDEAEALLKKIGYPRGFRPRWRDFRGASKYWAHVVAEIENGRLQGCDLELLTQTTLVQHPTNRVFLQAVEYGWRLRTYADQPVSSLGQDAFGFLDYADAFAILINNKETATPLTVAVSGPWGSGKTSLANLIEARLKVRSYWQEGGWSKDPITCWFNAWMNSDAHYLGAALAASVTRQVSRRRGLFRKLVSPLPSVMLSPERRAWRRVWTWLAMATIALTGFFALLGFFPELRPESGSLGRLYGDWQALAVYAAVPAVIAVLRRTWEVRDSLGAFIDSPRSAAAQGTLDEVRDQLGQFIRQAQRRGLGRVKRRVVIFIDDLERCPTDKALDICEVVSQLLSHADVITVLVADLDLLESAANARFRPPGDRQPEIPGTVEAGEQYLHKLIQFRFNLPPLDQSAFRSALALASSLDPLSPPSRGIRNRLAAARKWAHFHQVHVGVASLAVAFSVCVYLVVIKIHIPSARYVSSSPVSSSHASGFVAAIGGITAAVGGKARDTLNAAHGIGVDISRYPVILVGLAAAWIVYQVAGSAITRMSIRLRLRGTGSSTEARRLREYDESSRETAENEFTAYLPPNLRFAKRLINHQRLYWLIGKYRNIFGGEPELTHRHLVKWVLIIENWPRLGAALTNHPAMITDLEHASDVAQLKEALARVAPGVKAGGELLEVLRHEPSLSPVLARLVRFESSATPRRPVSPEAGGRQPHHSDGESTAAISSPPMTSE